VKVLIQRDIISSLIYFLLFDRDGPFFRRVYRYVFGVSIADQRQGRVGESGLGNGDSRKMVMVRLRIVVR
jgi:hypothetical protein